MCLIESYLLYTDQLKINYINQLGNYVEFIQIFPGSSLIYVTDMTCSVSGIVI